MGGFAGIGGGGGGSAPATTTTTTPTTTTPETVTPTVVSDTGYAKQFIDVTPSSQPQSQYDYIKSGQSQGIPGMAGEDLNAVLGDSRTQQFFSPFAEGMRGATSFLGEAYQAAGNNLPNQAEFTVPNQNPSATGESELNFGSRLVGNTDGAVDIADPAGSTLQTNQITSQPSGDISQPEAIAGPGEIIPNDADYRMAAYGSPNGTGFVPGARNAAQSATGPMSRTGFGQKYS